MRRSGSRGYRIGLVVVGLWYAVVLVWALRPLSETIYVGVDLTSDPPSQLSVTVECNSLFSSTARSEELPVLPAQPVQQPQLVFPREPCRFVRADARRAFAVDTGAVVVAVAGLSWFGFGRRRRGDADDPLPAVTSDASLVG